MDLENKTIKELEAIYQEASRNEQITRFEVIDESGKAYVNNNFQIELKEIRTHELI